MKKRLLALALAVLMAVSLGSIAYAGSSSGDLFANPGTYVVSVPGWIGSPIISTVTVSNDRIVSIQTNHSETQGFGDIAIYTMTAAILAHQTLGVDVVSGATLTSFAFLSSMHDALFNQAGGNRTRLMERAPVTVFEDTTADVVVVGSGVAGFNAAIRVASMRPDWNVILLEKDGILGGTSLRAGLGAPASGTQIQQRNGFFGLNRLEVDGGGPIVTATDDVRAMGGAAALEGEWADFFRLSAANSKYLMDFANEVRTMTTAFLPGTHGFPNDHRWLIPHDTKGFTAAIRGLEATALSHGVDIRVHNRGRYLLNPDGELATPNCDIGGIRVETPGGIYDIMAPAIVLATGGIAGNSELKAEFYVYSEVNVNTWRPNAMYYVYSPASARHSMGDGHVMGRQVGAALDMMHSFTARAQGIPGQDISGISNAELPHQDNFMSGAVPRMQGLLYICMEDGRRFSSDPNEPAYYFFDEDGNPRYYWGIMTHTGIVMYNSLMAWYRGGLFQSAYTIEEAADLIGFTGQTRANFIDEIRQIQHVAVHNVPGVTQAQAIEAAQSCNDPDCPFHGVAVSEDFIPNATNAITDHLWGSGPFYVTSNRIVPILHGTYGGVRINLYGQAIRGENNHFVPDTLAEAQLGDVITGLYAAGTVARPPRTAAPGLQASGSWGIAAANTILGLPPFDNSYWE